MAHPDQELTDAGKAPLALAPKLFDALPPRNRKRYGVADLIEKEPGVELALLFQGAIEGGDDRLLDLGAAEAFSGFSELLQVEARRILLAEAQVDAENALPLMGLGKGGEFPELARWLEGNKAALDLAIEAYRKLTEAEGR